MSNLPELSDQSISEAKYKMRRLEHHLGQMLNDFYAETGISVVSVSIEPIMRVGGSPVYQCEVEVRL